MSILTGPMIEQRREHTRWLKLQGYTPEDAAGLSSEPFTPLPWIDVTPWRPECVGPNSIDVHLADALLEYDATPDLYFDPLSPPPTVPVRRAAFTDGGWLLEPGTLYLGATEERIECHGVVPWIDGRSSTGRLGVSVHVTAGRGDDGWPGHGRPPAPFTLEITVVHPTILRPGMRVAQLTFMQTTGERRPYAGRYGDGEGPVSSRFHLPNIRPPEQPGH